jgi:sulfate permease, SulP family
MLLVAALTVTVGVEAAFFVGVVAAAGLLLQRTARPHWAGVGRLPGTEVFRNVQRFAVETLPHVLAVCIDASLLFTNSRWLSETMVSAPVQRPGLKHVVLMMSGVNDIDLTGLESLMHLARDLRAQEVQLHLSELKGPVEDRLPARRVSPYRKYFCNR